MLLRVRKFFYKIVEKIKPHDLRLINFSRNRAVCVIMWKITLSRQATGLFAYWIIKVSLTHIHSEYIFLLFHATLVTRTHHCVTSYVQCHNRSMLPSIAVHIHSVFCVPCTVCDNVQQCADTAILLR
jgi:hypothetical protein